MFKDSASLPFFTWSHILRVFHLGFFPVLFSFVIFVVLSLRMCLSACSFFVAQHRTDKQQRKSKKTKIKKENSTEKTQVKNTHITEQKSSISNNK
jgi:predicted membrane protein